MKSFYHNSPLFHVSCTSDVYLPSSSNTSRAVAPPTPATTSIGLQYISPFQPSVASEESETIMILDLLTLVHLGCRAIHLLSLSLPAHVSNSLMLQNLSAVTSSGVLRCMSSKAPEGEEAPKTEQCGPLTSSARKIQIAVVGSGPSGCFVATALTKQNPDVHVDILERLPVPFGLCRYGVSPDHPDVKNVERQFMELFKGGRVTWIGNVNVGKDLPLRHLLGHYAGVVFSTGADRSATLNIPGRDLAGVYSACDVVSNYNTLPYPHASPRYPPIPFDRTRRVAIIGNGNVAVDIARFLAASYQHFAPTDMNCFTIKELMKNQIHAVDMVARRGVTCSAFTTASFRELTLLEKERVTVEADPFSLERALEHPPPPGVNARAHRRMMELVHQSCAPEDSPLLPSGLLDLGSAENGEPNLSEVMTRLQKSYADITVGETHLSHPDSRKPRGPCTIRFRYGLTPIRFLPHPGDQRGSRLGGVLFKYAPDAVHQEDTAAPVRYAVLPCDAAIQSIGYHSDIGSAVDDLPVDSVNGHILNTRGRVDGLPRVYCSGWAKNGSKGVIMHSLNDAQETARVILTDIKEKALPLEPTEGVTTMQGKFGLLDYFVVKQLEPVSVAGLERIFYVEKNRGVDLGKRLEKIDSVRSMLDVALGGDVGKTTANEIRGISPARPRPLMYLKELLDDETDLSPFARSLAKDLPHRLAANHPPGAISPSQL
eukprot:gene4029-2883_t